MGACVPAEISNCAEGFYLVPSQSLALIRWTFRLFAELYQSFTPFNVWHCLERVCTKVPSGVGLPPERLFRTDDAAGEIDQGPDTEFLKHTLQSGISGMAVIQRDRERIERQLAPFCAGYGCFQFAARDECIFPRTIRQMGAHYGG